MKKLIVIILMVFAGIFVFSVAGLRNERLIECGDAAYLENLDDLIEFARATGDTNSEIVLKVLKGSVLAGESGEFAEHCQEFARRKSANLESDDPSRTPLNPPAKARGDRSRNS